VGSEHASVAPTGDYTGDLVVCDLAIGTLGTLITNLALTSA